LAAIREKRDIADSTPAQLGAVSVVLAPAFAPPSR
jgi:hypothetical protein